MFLNLHCQQIGIFLIISGFQKEVEQWNKQNKNSPNMMDDQIRLDMENVENPNEGVVMNIEQKIGEGEDGLISLPLFRVTGTSMDIQNLFEKLKDNEEPLGGENSFQPKSRGFGTQWKTRIG